MALQFFRGDSPELTFTLDDGSTFEPGDVVFFTMKRVRYEDDSKAFYAVSSADAALTFTPGDDFAVLQIPASVTDGLRRGFRGWYDWQLVRGSKVATLERDRVHVIGDVTRRTT